MGPLQHCSRLCVSTSVCACVYSPAPTLPMGQAHTPRIAPPCPWLPWKHTLSEPPREVHTPPPPPSVHCSLLSPDASVALSPSVPSSLLSSPHSLPSLSSFFPLSRCLSLAASPSVAWLGLRPLHHQGPNTHTHFTALTHTSTFI